MKDIRKILPTMASDTAGAASLLFETGGLTVIHDAAGSLEVFVTFDEDRDLAGCRTVTSRLSYLEAVTGDDSSLLEKLRIAAKTDHPNFMAVIGSPVPFVIGMDLDGIAAQAQSDTGVPAFAVNCGGFAPYDKGAGEALKKLITVMGEDMPKEKGRVNLLGVTPLDFSPAEINSMKGLLKEAGFGKVNTVTFGEGDDGAVKAPGAQTNIVVSLAGLPAAVYMKEQFGIPYVCGVPVSRETTQELILELSEGAPSFSASEEGRPLLVLGEEIFAKSIARDYIRATGRKALAGVTGSFREEIMPDVPAISLTTENELKKTLRGDYIAILGDPLYKLLAPDIAVPFIERPHKALSSRLYKPSEQGFDILIEKIRRL